MVGGKGTWELSENKKNKGLTVKQLLLTCKIGEADWNRSKSEEEKKDIELVMTFSIVGFCISLRGEEVPLTVIDGRVAFLVETSAHIFPHIMITLKGKVKGKNNLRCHCILIADQTKSGIPTWRWISRMMQQRVVMEDHKTGYFFP